MNRDDLTARQYAAIHLRVPDSGEEWLDNMIEKSLRNEFAARVIGGLVTDTSVAMDAYTEFGYKVADLMLKESK